MSRSTFRSQNVQNTPAPDISGTLLEVEMSKKCTLLCREAHFEVKMYEKTPGSDHLWKLRCRKSARRCGAKHISKSKCTKHTISGPLLEVEMSKKCTPLCCEANFEVKMYKTHPLRTYPDHFWKLRCRKSARSCGAKHISKSTCTKHDMLAPLLESDMLSRGRRKGLCTFSKVSKTRGICSISEKDGRRGTFEEDLRRCIFRGKRSTRDIFIRAVRRSGR